MTDMEQRAAAREFAAYWQSRGDEKQDTQTFWLTLLQKVLGVQDADKMIAFEVPVKLEHVSFIDAFIAENRVLIEQKGSDINLRLGYRQSDGSMLTPFQQARRYAGNLPHDQNPRWIVVCNFREFHIHDMNRPNDTPDVILLSELEHEYHRLAFLVKHTDVAQKREMELSIQAGELVGKLYDTFQKRYINPESEHALKSLNELCVRLVFCLYAEDAGIFGNRNMFHDYIKAAGVKKARQALIDLFRVLDTPENERDPYLDEDLAAFPYVNGGLFRNENIEIPQFNEEIFDTLLSKASANFDWSHISPTIFGAVFESTLNPETRRSGGMHYTSIENIHKVIDPLFLDGLRKELKDIQGISVVRVRTDRLKAFQQKLAGLTFLDPACGSGNFLTETYISLRRLENEVIRSLIDAQKGAAAGQIMMGLEGDLTPIMVSIQQFYGIEINDFAATVAKTALWIAESQMMKQTEDIVHMNLDFLPLKTYVNITEGNALRVDWAEVVPKERLNYIMGNPPFVGHQWRNATQVEDMQIAFYDLPKHGKLDYVCAWYNKAANLMQDTRIATAFVSTNSISQGESVAILWKFLSETKHVEIQFAYDTLVWNSEATQKAAVHCVIVGFTCYASNEEKYLFDGGTMQKVKHINGYLVSAADVYIQSRGKPLTVGLPEMSKGSQPTDGGNLILSPDEKDALLSEYPSAHTFVKRYVSADDYINNKLRYCLWLKGVSPVQYRNIPFVMQRLQQVAEMRHKSPTASVKRDADTPALFTQIRQPSTEYLAMPEVSSSRRRYIPFGYLSPDIIASNMLYLIPNIDKYMFGVMTSNVHMAWMRVVGGRLKSDYRYTPAVYNNFPWPTPTDAQKAAIERTAQAILDARALYPDCSLADLYDVVTMPPELLRAHQQNDKAVMQAYGFWGSVKSESDCVARLMEMYANMIK